ncbi:MAG: D-glycero-beta-D-manno-heptose 1,7-bisphosphate 7-phosphatase [Campylobacterales bacterium]|nr:D-glycero-beta-D-manno-heptose 1,7-bisphosphate 7-phosphatase [Campylobacterales bacterium]
MRKALFLDRDGVVNIEVDYLYKIEDFVFIDGIIELCKHYEALGYLIIIVTNQSGIARGLYTEAQYEDLTHWMIEEFAKHSVSITKVFHCPHHPKYTGDCLCRKPNPQMLLWAQEEFSIDMKASLLVGDKERDIEAAHNAGIIETYLFDETKSIKKSTATKIVTKLDEIWK